MREKPLKWRMLAALGRMINVAIRLPFAPMGKRREAIAVSTILEQLTYAYEAAAPNGAKLKFFSPGYKPAFRGISLFTKQPEVPPWIESFEPGDVFWDVGANVGAYSLYAASRPGVKVLAFEPEASNYYVLTRNIAINDLWRTVTAYNFALAEKTEFSVLSSFHGAIGGSKHAFGDPKESWEEDDPIVMQQGMVAFGIDHLIAEHDFPMPNHLKVDVDGIEEKILAGAPRTLRDPALRTVHIEVQKYKPEAEASIRRTLEEAGFVLAVESGPNLIWNRRKPESGEAP
jgi:FkbM family methyltransferase